MRWRMVQLGDKTMAASTRAFAKDTRTEDESIPLEEQIRQRAHQIYLQRGDLPGSELNDWLQAEEEILKARSDMK